MLSPDISIGTIGAGNMATALIEGLLANGVAPEHLWATDPAADKLQPLAAKGVQVSSDNGRLIAACDVVILAVKPQVMEQVTWAQRGALAAKPTLLISVAAGITCARLTQWTSPTQAIVRCMPNTPALVQAGASALFANRQVSPAQKQLALTILQAVGFACWLEDEKQMDAVTALSGSGPAYFFLLLEAMQSAGVELGLAPEVAKALAQQTAFGAAKLALNSEVDTAELRRRVTSPGGTTEAAIRQFESEHFRAIVARALQSAAKRSAELASS